MYIIITNDCVLCIVIIINDLFLNLFRFQPHFPIIGTHTK